MVSLYVEQKLANSLARFLVSLSIAHSIQIYMHLFELPAITQLKQPPQWSSAIQINRIFKGVSRLLSLSPRKVTSSKQQTQIVN